MKKDFEDKRAERKDEKALTKQNKALRKAKKQTQTALAKHKLGWRTRDGKEF